MQIHATFQTSDRFSETTEGALGFCDFILNSSPTQKSDIIHFNCSCGLSSSDGSGLRFFGLGRARALHTRARARVGPQPDFEAIYRAGSGFAFSGSGRARARVKNTVLAFFGLGRPRRSDLRSPSAPKARSLGKF